MAEQKSRIYSLPEITEINDDMYLMLDASDTGARRFNLKTFYDKVDGVQASADAANTAATAAAAAVDSANQAAQQAASAAESATTTVQGLVDDVNEAIEAVGDVTELAVPTMSPTVKGGAKLGSGLEVTDGTLSVNTVSSGDGSQAGPILSLSAKGWAEQDTTTGKNLLPPLSPSTKSGITLTVGTDGMLTFNGTASGNALFRAQINVSAGTYTLSANNEVGIGSSSSDSPYIFISNSDDHWANSIVMSSVNRVSTAIEQINLVRYTVVIPSGVTLSNFKMRPQLELGSTATEYEPYSGGAPSPSPDYPQEIRVCRGRNLLDVASLEQGGISGATGDPNNNDDKRVHSNVISVSPNTQYVVSADTGTTVNAYDYDANGNYITDTRAIQMNAVPFVFTTSANTRTVRLLFGKSGNPTITPSNIVQPQLERGPVATPYVPYGYVGMEVEVPSSLYKDGFYINESGVETSASGYMITSVQAYSDVMHVKAHNASSGSNIRFFGYSDNNSPKKLLSTVIAAGVTEYEIAVPDGVHEIHISSTSSVSLAFDQSTTPIPLPSRGWAASLPDGTADALTLDGAGKVTWERKCNEYVITGSESKQYSYDLGSCFRVQLFQNAINDCLVQDNIVNVMCSKLPSIGRAGWSEDVAHIAIDGRFGLGINCFVPNVNSQDDAVAAMVGATVLYPLETPVTEDAGYIEMPEIPVGAELRIPELDDLGVKYCVDASARDLAMMWYDRARGEYAYRLDGLDDDLVDTYGEIISANARIDTVSMDEDYDRQALNGTYAGRNIQTILGTSSFDATISVLHSRIASANFSGLRVGDFLNVDCGAYGTVRFDIAHFDPYYQMGSSAMGHHIAFVAHKPIALPSGDAYGTGTNNTYLAWNMTSTNQGTEAENCSYMCSHLHDWEINKLLPAMPTSLTNNLINRWEYLETRYAAAGGLTASTGRTWKQLGKVWSLSEMEVYGAVVWGTPGQSVGIGRQFDIFRSIHSQLHGQRIGWWLRTPSGVSASDVCIVSDGVAVTNSATAGWVRPRSGFLLG